METDNVCLFIPQRDLQEPIHIINFVLETMPQYPDNQRTLSFYRMHFVLEGQGILREGKSEIHLHEGDLFFCLPAVPYSLESLDGFQYAYISFLGSRANFLLDKFRINAKNCVFRGFSDLNELWRGGLSIDPSVADLRSESTLLHSFAEIGTKYYPSEEKSREQTAAHAVKRYIDQHFSDFDLSLKTLSEALSYNPKYLSALFKTAFKIGFSEYLNTVRVQNACALMQQGLTEVKNIAFLCGFNDPLYFSKVFKAQVSLTPRGYVKSLQNKQDK